MMTKMVQSVFPPPPMSCRLKMSAKQRNSSMNQTTQQKKMSNDQKTPRTG